MGWLSGWQYRKSHEIQGSSVGDQTNYQIKIVVHKGAGTDSGEDVYCNNHCRDDFGDIRFTKSDGETLLDYWMEEYTSGDKATFWVEVDSIPASPDKATVYIYYGKNDATTTSNGDNTFLFFDDFSDDLSKWAGDKGYFSISDGILTTTTSDKILYSTAGVSGDIAIESRVKINSAGRAHIAGRFQSDYTFHKPSYVLNYRYPNGDIRLMRSDPIAWVTLDSVSYSHSEVWRRARLFLTGNGADNEQKADFDGSGTLSATDTQIENTGRIRLGSNYFNTGGQAWWDWIFVRKYVSPEPSHGSWGIEEQSGATEVAITDSAAGTEALSRIYRGLNLTEIATGQESFGRPYRQLQIPEQASGLELLLKTRNLNLGDIAASLEIIERARQIGAITDTAQSLEQILKQRFISLIDAAAGEETIARPTRMIILADEALSQEILSKLRELTVVTDSAIGIEYVNVGAEGAIKTKIFLLIGDLAVQITGD